MQKRIGLIVAFTLFLLVVQAQQKLNYPEVDKVSYELYLQGKWTELIDYAKEARRQDIDFFYLQSRTGIAYYNLKKYRTASEWFLKAWENDQSFEWLQEYLYYSLIYSGRELEASNVAEEFTVGMKQKLNFQSMKPLAAAIEAGYSFNPDFKMLNKNQFEDQLQNVNDYGEAFFLKNYYFGSLEYSHQLAPGFNLNHNFTHIGISREEQLFWGENNSFPININQFQYYLNPYFVAGKKVYISPSLNIIWGNSDLVLGNFEPNTFYNNSYKYTDYIFTVSSWSHFGNLSPGAEINLANITDQNFTQLSAWLTVYPFSNLNFYFTPRAYFKNSEENGLGLNTFGISGGAQLGPVHFYGQYLKGEMENFIEPGGYVVSNFPGKSNRKFTGSVYFPLNKNLRLVFRYLNQDITEKYRVYSNGTEINSLNYSFIKHTITSGVTWIF
jgi:hypothetical protein